MKVATASAHPCPLQRRHTRTSMPIPQHGPSRIFLHYPSLPPPSTARRALALQRRPNPSPRCLTTSATGSPSTHPFPTTTGLVLDVGPPGSWDAGAVGSPVVKRFVNDNGERWLMWYHGQAPSPLGSTTDLHPESSVGLATSPDGVRWERSPAAVLGRGTDWWAFDTGGVTPAEVLVMSSDRLRLPSSVYWMYYTGLGPGGGLPGLAMSQDGRHWARIEGDHHSGALFDEGEGASKWGSSPCVVYRCEGDMRMYYHAPDEESGAMEIRVARSRDGIRWADAGRVEMEEGGFDGMGRTSPCVVEDAGEYVMAYEGASREGGRAIGLARSGNGLNGWRKVGEVLRKGGKGQWDEEAVGSPYLVRMDGGGGGKWWLYYSGVGGGGRMGIGLAVDGGGGGEFRRWDGLHGGL